MDCCQHAGVRAVATCQGCAEPFCEDCLVGVSGAFYCGSCKFMAVKPWQGPLRPCREAGEALRLALAGGLCCAVLVTPFALARGLEARSKIAMNPRLLGIWKANAAILLSLVGLGFWAFLGLVKLLAWKP